MSTDTAAACPVCKFGVVADGSPKNMTACWLCGGTGSVDSTRQCTCGMPANQLELKGNGVIASCGKC